MVGNKKKFEIEMRLKGGKLVSKDLKGVGTQATKTTASMNSLQTATSGLKNSCQP